ncbi:hypothetical protein HYDPIDRAFT_190662 [Hydnomerulius pinastri MD-312]|uniref:Uncharacterized protein n=1 Tax=Hydnomerulius pinastri MD-312 TaxID=994086 RepID=A0A0C9W8G5_9AGAM|nr:hypothetical protein HYDPIDRAFT_190662 [Hydnomerulius pinastri MD-312]
MMEDATGLSATNRNTILTVTVVASGLEVETRTSGISLGNSGPGHQDGPEHVQPKRQRSEEDLNNGTNEYKAPSKLARTDAPGGIHKVLRLLALDVAAMKARVYKLSTDTKDWQLSMRGLVMRSGSDEGTCSACRRLRSPSAERWSDPYEASQNPYE